MFAVRRGQLDGRARRMSGRPVRRSVSQHRRGPCRHARVAGEASVSGRRVLHGHDIDQISERDEALGLEA